MNDKIRIDLGFATLVAEDCTNEPYRQVAIYLEREGYSPQDVVLVGVEPETGEESTSKEISVLVWSDCNDEDYTDKFEVGLTTLDE